MSVTILLFIQEAALQQYLDFLIKNYIIKVKGEINIAQV